MRKDFLRRAVTGVLSAALVLSLFPQTALQVHAADVPSENYYGSSSDNGDGTFDNDAVVDSDVADPDIIRVGNAYYMSSTSMHFSPGAPIMKSYDLVNWEVVNYAYNIIADYDELAMRDGKYDYGKGSWATSLRYRESDRKYYLCHTSNTTHKTYFYRTDDIENGTWEQIVCDTFYHDSSMVFVGEDAYIFHGSGTIYVDKLKDDFSGSEWSKPIITAEMTTNIAREFMNDPSLNNTFLEATHAYCINGTYYVFMCGWPSGKHKTQYVFKCDTVDGTYDGKIIIHDPYTGDEGVGQGGIVQMEDGNWMGFFMHKRGAAGRGMVLTPCTFDENGWPIVADENGELTVDTAMEVPIDGTFEKASVVNDTDFDNDGPQPAYTKQAIPANPDGEDNSAIYGYNGSNLPLGFEWNHNPDNRYWSMTERSGYLRLTNGYIEPNGNTAAAKNVLTARTYGPECWGQVAMEIDGMKNGDVAGFGTFSRNYGYCGVKMEDGKKYIIYRARQGDGQFDPFNNNDPWVEDVLMELPADTARVYFKVYNDYKTYGNEYAHFYYSVDGVKWEDPGKSRKVEFGYPTHFVGTRFGIFSFATEETGGYVDVDYFKLGDLAPVPLTSHYEPLGDAINRAKDLVETDWTESTWSAMETALAAAETAYAASGSEDSVYETAYQSLRTAINNLAPKNYDALRAMLEEAKQVNTFDWTAEDIAALELAIDTAQKLVDGHSQNNAKLTAALEALTAAMEAQPVPRMAVAANAVPDLNGDDLWTVSTAIPVNRVLGQSSVTGTAKLLWNENSLYVLVDVSDTSSDGADDTVKVLVNSAAATVDRTGAKSDNVAQAVVKETAAGYTVAMEITATDLADAATLEVELTDHGQAAARWYTDSAAATEGGPLTLQKTDMAMLRQLVEDLSQIDTSCYAGLEAALAEARALLDNGEATQRQVLAVYDKLVEATGELEIGYIRFPQLPDSWEIYREDTGKSVTFGESGATIVPGSGDYPQCPNILQKKDAPTGDWVVVLKTNVEREFSGSDWKQYGVGLYLDDNNWVKLVQCGANNGAYSQFNYKKDGSTGNGGDLGTKELSGTTTWLKLVKTGSQISGYTSVDGENFDLFGTHTLAENMANAKLQLFTTSGFGSDAIATTFEYVRMATDLEKIDKTELNALLEEADQLVENDYTSGWEAFKAARNRAHSVSESEFADQAAVSAAIAALRSAMNGLSDGAIHFDSLPENWEVIHSSGEIQYSDKGATVTPEQGDYPNSKNILQYNGSMAGDWTATVKLSLDAELTGDWQQCGMALYLDDDNWVKLIKCHDMSKPSVQFNYKKNGSTANGGDLGTPAFSGTEVWLRLEKTGNQLTGSYSGDGVTYTTFGTHTLEGNMESAKLQLYASAGFAQSCSNTTFESIRLEHREPEQPVSCDVNGDQVVDLLDVVAAMKWYGMDSTGADWDQAQIANVDGDSDVDLQDLITIVMHFTISD